MRPTSTHPAPLAPPSAGAQGTFRHVSDLVVAVFTSRQEADSYLVSKAWDYKERGAEAVVVVSSDRQVVIGVRAVPFWRRGGGSWRWRKMGKGGPGCGHARRSWIARPRGWHWR